MNGGVHHVVDDRGDCEDASQDADNIDEEGVPLVMGINEEYSHRVCLVSE